MADHRRATGHSAVAVALLVAALSGCAGVPDSGPVKDEKSLPLIAQADDVHVLAESAHAGQSPVEVVRGFLRAAASFDDDHAVARTYLDDKAATSWRPSGAVVYGSGPQVSLTFGAASSALVSFSAPKVADLSADGTWQPAPAGALVRDRFSLVKRGGDWRISSPPAQLRLTPGDIERSFRAVSVFFLSPDRSVVVPDHRYLPVDRRALSTALVRAVIAGPSRAVESSVRTAIPVGTKLIGTAPSVDGVVTVDLSRAVLDADARGLVELSAQLVWTLRELGTEFTDLRLLAEGAPLRVAGAAATQHFTAWEQFDADDGADVGAYLDNRGRLTRIGQGEVPGPLGRGTLHLASPVLGPDASTVAGIGPGPSLWVGPTNRPSRVLRALGFSAPSMDHSGRVWSIARLRGGQRVIAVDNGTVRTVSSGLPRSGLSELRVSRDGTELAVVQGGRLLVGRVDASTAMLRVVGLVAVAPGLSGVGAVSWADGNDLALLARNPANGRVVPWFVSSDGYRVQQVPTTGDDLSTYRSIAAGPGSAPLLVGDGVTVYRYVAGRWRAVDRGSAPTYPG